MRGGVMEVDEDEKEEKERGQIDVLKLLLVGQCTRSAAIGLYQWRKLGYLQREMQRSHQRIFEIKGEAEACWNKKGAQGLPGA
jgi:hypothetical protein